MIPQKLNRRYYDSRFKNNKSKRLKIRRLGRGGWLHDSLRHINARKLGKAGHVYRNKYKNKQFITETKNNSLVIKMDFNIPYLGKVEREVLKILYPYINSGRRFSTPSIARGLHDERDHVYGALQKLNEREYIRKTHGNPCRWRINSDKINEIRKIIKVPEPDKDYDEGGNTQPTKEIAIQIGVYALKKSLPMLISSIPVINGVYCTYYIADTLVSHWSLIEESYKGLRKEGLVGAGKAVVKDIASGAISNTEAGAVWDAIGDKIPTEYRSDAKDILSNVIENITNEEIDYVEQRLE